MMNTSNNKNGHIRSVVPAETTSDTRPNDDRFDATASLLRLLVGGALVGAEELRLRLERWQEATRASTTTATQAVAPQTASDALRYTLVGMLFETETRMRRRFSAMLARLARASHEANLFYTTVTSDMRYTPLDPLRMRLDEMLYRATMTIDRWTDRGWIEEQHSRRMAREAAARVVDELLDYMAQNPEVRELIEQQSLNMAETAVDEVRDRTATADMWIERIARSLLHRPVNDQTNPNPTKSVGEAHTSTPEAAEVDAFPARQSR
jgi:hypothetical protein